MSYLDKINNLKEEYKVLKKELISSYEDGYIGKKTYKYYLSNGTVKVCDQITKNGRDGDAVVIIPILKNGNIMLVLESRPNTLDGASLSFPAGMIEEAERPIDAAIRELREETGLVASDVSLLESHYQDQGCSAAKISTFVAKDCEKIDKQNLDESEQLIPIELTWIELFLLLDNQLIDDANSKIAALTYKYSKKK